MINARNCRASWICSALAGFRPVLPQQLADPGQPLPHRVRVQVQDGGGPAEVPTLTEPGVQGGGQVGAAAVVVVQDRTEGVLHEPSARCRRPDSSTPTKPSSAVVAP